MGLGLLCSPWCIQDTPWGCAVCFLGPFHHMGRRWVRSGRISLCTFLWEHRVTYLWHPHSSFRVRWEGWPWFVNVSDEEVAVSVASLSQFLCPLRHSGFAVALANDIIWLSCLLLDWKFLVASSCTLPWMNHLASVGQSQKCKLPSGLAAKWDLSTLATAMECCCPKWMEMSITLVAAGRQPVNIMMFLHPVVVTLPMARQIQRLSIWLFLPGLWLRTSGSRLHGQGRCAEIRLGSIKASPFEMMWLNRLRLLTDVVSSLTLSTSNIGQVSPSMRASWWPAVVNVSILFLWRFLSTLLTAYKTSIRAWVASALRHSSRI